jgi:hypothetical protein
MSCKSHLKIDQRQESAMIFCRRRLQLTYLIRRENTNLLTCVAPLPPHK